ncbi:MAG TPA: sodium/glutamate symporter [Burkholderiales bacterium]|nr:sodium/glutamate symporter [Burkholderiales bacterium]
MVELQSEGVLLVRPFLAVTAGIVVLFVGKALNRRFAVLREYNIPEPVTGGLLFAIGFWLVHLASGYRVTFELTARDVLLVYFFTTIGINARVSDLKAGGRPLVLLLAAVAVFMLLQNGLGVAVASLFGRPLAMGVLAGSVSLLGGHGTAIAWAPTFVAQRGIENALEIGVLSATMGLVLASLAGGPVARFLVERHRLEGPAGDAPEVGVHYGDAQPGIDYFSFLHAILAIHVCAVIGILVHEWLEGVGFKLPLFVPCLLAGIVLTNALPRFAPRVPWPARSPALALIAEVSLGVFLSMSLMSMQLWALAELAGPLLVLLGLEFLLAVAFAGYVLFPVLGRNYDAAVICAGFVGFGLGATPTAMANMTAVTQRHGASHVAFLVVPLVGAFFIDLLNTVVIRLFLAWL